ncbi:MAG: Asp23/Gls24 family envelope stress response protein [Clostridia bacterium]|nr:Asp23/Gls24 family envelope stress response protein [Clostridia bacterium]
MVKVENPLGTIEITEEYFSELLGNVVPTCFGVAGMADSNAFQGIRSFLDRKHQYLDRGVSVVREPDGLVIGLHIVVTYGVNISEVVKNIVEKVRYTIEEVTDMDVKKINVYVDSMIS